MEIAGNKVDENCDRFLAPPPRMGSTTVLNSWSVLGTRATLTRLRVKRLRRARRSSCAPRPQVPVRAVKAKGKAKRGVLNVLPALKGKRRTLRAAKRWRSGSLPRG